MSTIVLVGAARSGTKILRDTLASAPGISVVPYDINYIWRLGNEDAEDDAFSLDRLPTAKVEKIRDYLHRCRSCAAHLVEKTVATPLRIPFVDAVLPGAQYVFLVRDPTDVVESSMRQWLAPPNWRYSMKKAMSYPWFTAPGYAVRQVAFAAKRVVRTSGTVPPWGPVYPGMIQDLAADVPVVEVCAKQWRACNAMALKGFQRIGKTPVVVPYEDFARNPKRVIERLCERLDIRLATQEAIAAVRSDTVGAGTRYLTAQDLEIISKFTNNTWVAVKDFVRDHPLFES